MKGYNVEVGGWVGEGTTGVIKFMATIRVRIWFKFTSAHYAELP